jgi:hypothetical protein
MRFKYLLVPKHRHCVFLAITFFLTLSAWSQSDKDISASTKKLAAMDNDIDRQTQKLLDRLQKQEGRLEKKISSKDSVRAKQLFLGVSEKLQAFRQAATSAAMLQNAAMADRLRNYVPGADSLQTALSFLTQYGKGLSAVRLQQLQAVSSQLQQLQGRLQVASTIQNWMKEREAYLQQQLAGLKVSRSLTSLNKESYYYQQRISTVKSALSDRDKLKQELLNQVTAQPDFQKFWQKHSFLASMFPMAGEGDTATDKSLANLQTRSQVNKLIAEKLGQPGAQPGQHAGDGQAYLAQQVQQAKSQLDVLKNRARQLGISSSSNEILIPTFTPNNQRTKPFLKRLEVGFNIQNTPGSSYLPATSNIGFMLGYKVSDNFTAGTGIAYLLGWGRPVKDIHFSSQGIGLRSYADIRIKKNWWATGGFEYNYMNAFSSLSSLQHADIWQKSALVGLTKKYRMGNKYVNLQLLYDLLAASQTPAPSPVKFRVGYSF